MKKIILFLSAISMLGLTSCLDTKETESVPVPKEVSYYVDCRFAFMNYTVIVDQALAMTNLAVNNPTGTSVPTGIVLTPTYDANQVLSSLDITYTSNSNTKYTGTIKIAFTGAPLTNGSVMNITLDTLSYSGIKLDGAVTIGYNVSDKGEKSQTIQVANARLTDAYGAYISWNCNLNRVFSEGAKPSDTADDTYAYTGSGAGTTALEKVDFVMNIKDSLVITDGYVYFSKGKLSMQPSTYAGPYFIEFGLGQSINQVYLIYLGVSGLYTV